MYRSFATVLGEAISNSWDADAKNVWIDINRDENSFFIKDDGDGMTNLDFQNKFLKIGYSKRSEGQTASCAGRPYIGRKGIGKLALLSCAEKIHVISKTDGADYIGGTIDNSGLDDAIKDDLSPEQYELGQNNLSVFALHTAEHEKGTIIYFENIKDGIKNNLDYLRKIIALYFRFSLLDGDFNIFINGKEISLDDLDDLAEKTEFLWKFNDINDPYINKKLTALKEPAKDITMAGDVTGFIASVSKPSDLKIIERDERASVDLFVNGRLRELNILKHIPTSRIAENYLYGQIHFNSLDDDKDRFTTSREGIIAEDPKFKEFLENLRSKISEILEDWDKWRLDHGKNGDAENNRISQKERSSIGLHNAVSKEYKLPAGSKNKGKVDNWVDGLKADAIFNFMSYADCFVSENLIRKYIRDKNIKISDVAENEIAEWKRRETASKADGNVNIDIRSNNDDLSYLDMTYLSKQADKDGVQNTLVNYAKTYRPFRNAVAHTARLTDEAKRNLASVYDNIKAGIKNKLS